MLVSSRNGPHTESAMGLDARESARINVCHSNSATRCARNTWTVIKDCCCGTRFVVGSISDREHGSCTGSSHSANADYWRTCRGTPTSRAANRLIHLFVKGLTKPMTACLPLVTALNCVCLLIRTCCNTTRCGPQQERGMTTSVQHLQTSCVSLVVLSPTSSAASA